jgi:hypothetical protein
MVAVTPAARFRPLNGFIACLGCQRRTLGGIVLIVARASRQGCGSPGPPPNRSEPRRLNVRLAD